MMYLY